MVYIPGKGTVIQLSIATVFTTIAQLVAIKPPSRSMGTVETTIITDAARTHIATILDEGEGSFIIEYDPDSATHAQLNTSFVAGTAEAWKINLPAPASSVFAFSAIITGFDPEESTVDSVQRSNLSFKVTGLITITP